MVATDPSEDAELQTTRLRTTSVPCLGLILRCPSFLHVHSLLWFMFPFTDNTTHISLYDYIFDVDTHPYADPDSFLLFFVVLLTFFSHDITLPLFLLIHLSNDPVFCLLIIPTLLIAFVSFQTGLLRTLTHTDSIVVQPYDVTMTSGPLLYIRYQSVAD